MLGLAVGLRDYGFRTTHIIVDYNMTEFHQELLDHGISSTFIPRGSRLSDFRAIQYLRHLFCGEREIPKVVSHGQFASLATALAFRTTRNTHTYFRHFGFPIRGRSLSRQEAYDAVCSRSATMTIVASGMMHREMLKRLPTRKLHRITFGIDSTRFRPFDSRFRAICRDRLGISRSKTVIGIVARWEDWKGLQFSLPAIRQLMQEGYPLHIVMANAHGPFAEYVNRELARMSHDSVTLVPYTANMSEIYGAMDINVHVPLTPTVEAFGLTTVEAMMSAIAGVYTPSGIADELVDHNRTGIRVPFQDTQSIRDALRELIEDTELRYRVGNAAFERVKHMDIQQMTDSWATYLRG